MVVLIMIIKGCIFFEKKNVWVGLCWFLKYVLLLNLIIEFNFRKFW